MNLRKYIARTGYTHTDLAHSVGCSQNYMSSIVRGEKIPSKKLAAKIVHETGGLVKMVDLRPYCPHCGHEFIVTNM